MAAATVEAAAGAGAQAEAGAVAGSSSSSSSRRSGSKTILQTSAMAFVLLVHICLVDASSVPEAFGCCLVAPFTRCLTLSGCRFRLRRFAMQNFMRGFGVRKLVMQGFESSGVRSTDCNEAL